MAKRTRKASNRLDSAATTLGTGFGHLAGRIDALKKQRQAVAAELNHLIASARGMLSDLGEEASAGAARVRKARGAKKKKRRLSAKGRANIIAAAKKRWARYHAGKK